MPHVLLRRPRCLAVLPALLALSLAAAPAQAQSPSASIDALSPQQEGGVVTFRVTYTGEPGNGATVRYRTVALAGEAKQVFGSNCAGDDDDYLESSGLLTFPAGADLDPEISVITCPDDLDEADEHFRVELYDEDNVTVPSASRSATGEIIDLDEEPSLNLENASVTESDADETSTLAFDVHLDEPSGRDVTFNYSTIAATATAGLTCDPGRDYLTSSDHVTIPAGALTPAQPIRVTVCGDDLDENDETLRVKLNTPVNAAGTPQATGTIIDDDASPSLSSNVASVTVTEGETGTTNAAVPASLSTPSGRSVTVNWSTQQITARGGTACGEDVDYKNSGTLSIPAGASGGVINVPVCGDRPDEINETFRITLTSQQATGAPQAIATINDNDPPPRFHFGNLARAEGSLFSGVHPVGISLIDPRDGLPVDTGRGVQFALAASSLTANGPGMCGGHNDYGLPGGVPGSIAADTNATNVNVTVCANTVPEASERFNLLASNVVGAEPTDVIGEFTIINDDGPQLILGSAGGYEGTMISLPVTLVGATSDPVHVEYKTSDGTAHSGSACGSGVDYRAAVGSLDFPESTATSQTKTIMVFACPDAALPPEPPETFTVRLSNPDFARITVGDATGVIG